MPRIPESIKNPAKLFNGPGSLGRLYRQASALISAEQQIRAKVSGEVYVAGFEAGKLHLTTPSAALATQLRYRQRRFIGKLRINGELVAAIEVSVRPVSVPTRTETPGSRTLPPAVGQQIADSASHIDDPALRSALLRLSKRCNPADTP